MPIDCLSYDNNLVYLFDPFVSMNKLPSHCRRFKTVEIISVHGYVELQQAIERLFERQEIFLAWEMLDGCYECENSGNFCGFNSTRNATICSTSRPKRSHSAVILGTSIGGTAFLALVVLVLYRFRRSDSEKETQLKVERFLANYKTLNPSRYSYSDLKKITGKFRHKVGQGGYGTVYRGKLPNGIPAAVKMIEISKGNGQEFINEVATIGRIHHFNVVRLLGFCAEGTRRALVYEFMPNESLEKFIFSSKDAKTRNRPFSWEKLQQIAMGIARGMEYLHQGCNQRILHFDIKPHNILLDHNFQPKISDFGLAKLCSKERSVVSMTAARGTAGYIAPELFSRNFGAVSHKSDVFSFGMLLLEIVGCRRNIDVTVENQSQIYFPELIYNRMSQGKEMGLEIEIDGDEEIAKKLAIVALWCIQWNPTDRPSMTMVVQMLEGDLHGLEIPPKPFASSDIEMIAT